MVQTQFTITITEPMISAAIKDVGGFPGDNNGNNKISAIKEVRTRYGIGLREAKELVETIIIPKKEFRRVVEIVDYVFAYTSDEVWNLPLPDSYTLSGKGNVKNVFPCNSLIGASKDYRTGV